MTRILAAFLLLLLAATGAAVAETEFPSPPPPVIQDRSPQSLPTPREFPPERPPLRPYPPEGYYPPPTEGPPPAPNLEALQKRLEDSYRGRQEDLDARLDPSTGRLLTGYTDTDEAFRQLYANGLEEAKELGLTVGVELTRDQVARLRKDIIWHVVVKKDGKDMLVPRLYLAKGRVRKNEAR